MAKVSAHCSSTIELSPSAPLDFVLSSDERMADTLNGDTSREFRVPMAAWWHGGKGSPGSDG